MATTNKLTFNGLSIGAGTAYGLISVEGIDGFSTSPATVNVTRADGGLTLTQTLPPRVIRFSVRVPDSGLAAFKAAYTRTDIESALDIVWDDMPNVTSFCRVTSRDHVRTRESEFEARRVYVVEMQASSPFLLGTTQRSVALTNNVNSAALSQLGDMVAYPTCVLTGVDGLTDAPIVFTNVTTGEILSLSAADAMSISVGDTLSVDFNPLIRTVLQNDGTVTSMYKEVTVASAFWGISASDIIKFTATFTISAPTCTFYWYDTYL